ncbi:dTMP kinase [Enterococcus faecalis]|uniref:dTMP kinase n=1 Tax=Enterococcus faecalis TaxID=1351 RepID=UPI0019FEA0DB|nr:hypothetical protein [Enterococcus faecalis]EGO8510063.1 hypothetical protein [Enterococcus faecalis]EGO8997145.1 hypothetical protein [Enterococcus faecalis]EGQ7429180.1 hypothetical protein [Enterococcus faecalis]
MKKGRLISLEGIDGVGKTSCASYLCNQLNSSSKDFIYINRKEIPTTNNYIKLHMEYLYAIMWGQGDVFSQAPNTPYNGFNCEHWRHLMIAWYSAFEQHVIFPVLEKGISVITDGYVHKEIAKAIHSTKDFKTATQFDFLYKPDLIFYLTASPEDCIRDDSNENRVESGAFSDLRNNFIEHQYMMKDIYDNLATECNWIVINRNQNIEITCKDIIKTISSEV